MKRFNRIFHTHHRSTFFTSLILSMGFLFLIAGCSGNSKSSNDSACTTNAQCLNGYACQNGQCMPSSNSCSYTIDPTDNSLSSNGGYGSISVSAGSGCSWNATSNVSWITITSGSSGSGNGTVNYLVSENTGASCQYGTITVAGNTFIVTQAGTSGSCLANSVWPKFHGNMQNTGLSSIDTSANTGTLKWSYTTGNSINSSPAIGADGTIYVGSEDGNLYAINPNGGLKWSYTTGSWIESSPAIGADGTIYVGSYDNKLYAINPNGTLKWSYTTGNYIFSSPAIGADGTIYVGSHDYNLYAIH